jgi:hypothetical protein
MAPAGFTQEIHRALQKGVPAAGVLVIFAHIFFIGADLGFPGIYLPDFIRHRLVCRCNHGDSHGAFADALGAKPASDQNSGLSDYSALRRKHLDSHKNDRGQRQPILDNADADFLRCDIAAALFSH